MTLTVAQAFKVALDMWEIAQEGEVLCHVCLFRLYMAHNTQIFLCLDFSIADKSKKVHTCYSCSDPESQPESEPNSVSGTFIGLNTMVCFMSC